MQNYNIEKFHKEAEADMDQYSLKRFKVEEEEVSESENGCGEENHWTKWLDGFAFDY